MYFQTVFNSLLQEKALTEVHFHRLFHRLWIVSMGKQNFKWMFTFCLKYTSCVSWQKWDGKSLLFS